MDGQTDKLTDGQRDGQTDRQTVVITFFAAIIIIGDSVMLVRQGVFYRKTDGKVNSCNLFTYKSKISEVHLALLG